MGKPDLRPLRAFAVASLLLLPALAAGEEPGEAVLPARDLLHMRRTVATQPGPVRGRTPNSGSSVGRHLLVGEAHLETSGSDDGEALEHGGIPRNMIERPPVIGSGDLEGILKILSGFAGPGLAVDESAGMVRVPLPAAKGIAAALARVRARRPPTVDLEVQFDSPGASPSVILAGRGPAPPGEAVVFADVKDRLYVSDYDVEIAQAASIADPIVLRQRTGASVTARVSPLPGGEAVLVELVARTATPRAEEPIHPHHAGFGAIDRAAVAIGEAGLTFRLEPGKPVEHSWTGPGGKPLRLRVTARWSAPIPEPGPHAFLWSPVLGGSVVGFFNAWLAEPPDETEDLPAAVELDLRTEALLGAWAPAAQERCTVLGGGIVLVEGGDDKPPAGPVRDEILGALDAEVRPARMEVVVADVPAGTEVARDGRLPEGSKEIARVSGSILLGVPACFNAGVERRYLKDWDVEVAQGSRIPDPIVSTVEEGQFLDLQVRADADGRPGLAELRLDLVRLEGIETDTLILDVPLPTGVIVAEPAKGSGSGAGETSVSPSLPQDSVAVERPTVRRLRIAGTVTLGPDGIAVFRRSSQGFLGDGREAVVILRVR